MNEISIKAHQRDTSGWWTISRRGFSLIRSGCESNEGFKSLVWTRFSLLAWKKNIRSFNGTEWIINHLFSVWTDDLIPSSPLFRSKQLYDPIPLRFVSIMFSPVTLCTTWKQTEKILTNDVRKAVSLSWNQRRNCQRHTEIN